MENALARLRVLFGQIEQEFQALIQENATLRENLARATAVSGSSSAAPAPAPPLSSLPSAGPPAIGPPPSVGPKEAHKAIKQKTVETMAKFTRWVTHVREMTTTDKKELDWSPQRRFCGHTDGIWDVAAFPASSGFPGFATASCDGTVLLWHFAHSRPFACYAGHTGSVNAVRIHPTHPLAVSASGDGTAHIWAVPLDGAAAMADTDGDPAPLVISQPLLPLGGHKGVVSGACWVDAAMVATCGWDGTVRLWGGLEGSRATSLLAFQAHQGLVTEVCAHPARPLLLTASDDRRARVWDTRSPGVCAAELEADDVVRGLALADDKLVVTGSDDQTLRLWDLRSSKVPLASVKCGAGVNRLSIAPPGLVFPGGPAIATPLDSGTLRVYEVGAAAGAFLAGPVGIMRIQPHAKCCTSTAWLPVSDPSSSSSSAGAAMLLSASFDGCVGSWAPLPGHTREERERERDRLVAQEKRTRGDHPALEAPPARSGGGSVGGAGGVGPLPSGGSAGAGGGGNPGVAVVVNTAGSASTAAAPGAET
ncbi:putative WD repeat domain 37 [Paratrimastix pyriformis]|uniref:WD repeat domain 37 n=1 Tax=Paratrimastix pyriformis TaxID=342808 RepID=A0ABQ8U7S5_9EUKA|nr:putative WD repeat domain 37 [Paratrimastix pyriformis]